MTEHRFTPKHIGRLADRARRWAEEAIIEQAYVYSYGPTTRRYDQAMVRFRKAEQKMLKAFDELTTITARMQRGE